MSTTTPVSAAALDAVAAEATELARIAAEEEAGDPAMVGAHLGVDAAGPRVVVHRFACLNLAYPGWYWAVELARAPRARQATVDDVVLLPGDGALVAPPWVPWSERLRPGDVGAGALLPTAADDARLALRLGDTEGWVDDDLWIELGLGRARVLSAIGRDDASERWYTGDAGPGAQVAVLAPGRCASCGFFVKLVGALGQLFGVCANVFAPDDARVISADHGCGAHSEALVLPSAHPAPVSYDDASVDLVDTSAGSVAAAPAGSGDEGEPYGHS